MTVEIDYFWLKENVFDRLDNERISNIKVFKGDLMQEKSFDQLDLKKKETNIIYECL